MPLWLAAALLVLSLSGIFLSRRYLRKPLQSVCVILCVLLAAACAAYIGLPFCLWMRYRTSRRHRKKRSPPIAAGRRTYEEY